ncbi:diacylglycerol kinase family protein [Planctomyces sp. SH-PL14]|uniref:diacylglycerol kinase family protein n=1 Tax=Planctomyces sp. SH-PL14 TaxID=1632864 RepID=UPI00078D306E|nr:diacylglycerol kinase family protein [Planctomyces sp. SH-PL14]AMV17509.1 Undecaprenol kinase [Planctomyces sp. SH-PL14]
MRDFLLSFVYAGRGIAALFARERNARVHLVAAVVVVAAGVFWRIEPWEWCAVAMAIATVTAAEAFNTAIEALLNRLHPDRDSAVGHAKDLAAGGVLLAALGAAAVGAAIFGPRLWVLVVSPR